MATYFITGATGSVGKELVEALLAQNQTVIAATRHPEKAQELFGERVQAVAFDFADESTYAQALKSDGIFLLGPPLNPALFSLLTPFVDYLDAQKAPKVVYLSGNGMEDLPALPFHGQMEEKLQQSSLDWYVVRPSFFMQNFGNYERENIEARSIVFVPAGEGKTAFISTKDIGAATAALLQLEQPKKRTYVLTGGALYDHFDAAQQLTTTLGKTVNYANPDNNTYRQVLKEAQAPDFIADYMIPIYGLIKEGKVATISSDVQALTGQAPESLAAVLSRDFS
ncbi:MAG: NAD(P)H-binding protein [Aureispira sp.]